MTPAGGRTDRWVRARSEDRGTMTVEVAVLALPLMLVAGFVVLVGRLGGADADVGQAARDAARAGSLYLPDRARPEAVAAARSALDASGTACVDLTVAVTTSGRPGDLATATVTCVVRVSEFPLLGPVAKTVTATAAHPIDSWRADP